MSEFLQSLIDNARKELDAMSVGAEHPQIRSALMDLRMAQSLLDRGMVSADGKTDKGINFAFRAHIHNAIRALHAVEDEPRLARDAERQAGTQKNRRGQWPQLDADIEKILTDNPKLTARQIFDRLPDSFSGESYYRDDDLIVSESGRELKFGGFQKRVSTVSKKINNSR